MENKPIFSYKKFFWYISIMVLIKEMRHLVINNEMEIKEKKMKTYPITNLY
jgi:hypothetical protein